LQALLKNQLEDDFVLNFLCKKVLYLKNNKGLSMQTLCNAKFSLCSEEDFLHQMDQEIPQNTKNYIQSL